MKLEISLKQANQRKYLENDMAEQSTLDRVKRRLQGAWEDATSSIQERTEQESRRLGINEAKGDQLKSKINSLVREAIGIEADERAKAISGTVVNDLLNVIETLEGRIENLEERLNRIDASSPTGVTTTA